MRTILIIYFIALSFTQSVAAQSIDDHDGRKIIGQCAESAVDLSTFAACTFGEFTKAEVLKCLQGDCLGPNNELVKLSNKYVELIGGCKFVASNPGSNIYIINDTDREILIKLKVGSGSSSGSEGKFTMYRGERDIFNKLKSHCGARAGSVRLSASVRPEKKPYHKPTRFRVGTVVRISLRGDRLIFEELGTLMN